MGEIKFGVRMREWLDLDLCRKAEELGYDSLWMSEHMLFHVPILDAFVLLAAYAARTQRVKVGTAVTLLPLRHPINTAKAASTLDYISGGRFILGIGVGGEYPKEFEACGVPIQERGRRTDEIITILRRLWREDHVTHHGRFYQFEDVTMEPKPTHPGGPPIWTGGRSEGALRRAARFCDGFLPYFYSPERYREAREKILQIAREEGRDMSSFTWALFQFIHLADSYQEARRRALYYLGHIYRQDFEPVVDKYCVLGRAQDCIKRLEEFVEAGARYIVLVPLCTNDDFPHYLERYAREIIPHFQRA